jgi:hypothetical protein
MSVTFTLDDLRNFTCTEHHYRHPFNPKCLYTDGVKHVAANGCGWFLDIIALQPPALRRKLASQPFQVWTLTSDADHNGKIVVTDGNSKRPLYTKRLDFTDWPPGQELVLWVEDGVVLLPSEH